LTTKEDTTVAIFNVIFLLFLSFFFLKNKLGTPCTVRVQFKVRLLSNHNAPIRENDHDWLLKFKLSPQNLTAWW
jgi:hypothetical protein